MSSSYDFQAHLQHSQRSCFSQTALLWFDVLPELLPALRGLSSAHRDLSPALPDLSPADPGAPKVFSSAPQCSQTYHNHSHGTPVAVICDPSYSEARQECPPRVWYSPEINASKITLHILSDTPGVFQWLKYILLMCVQLWPVSYRLAACDCTCRIRIQEIPGEGPALASLVTRLLWTHGLCNRPCNHQLTQLGGNVSNLIDSAIGSVCVFVWCLRYNWFRSSRLRTRLLAGWPPISTRNCLCYC